MIVTLDIETVPTDDAVAELAAEIEAECASAVAPANYKSPEAIADAIDRARAKIRADGAGKMARLGLDGATGKIVCLSYAVGDGAAVSFWGHYERQILRDAMATMALEIQPGAVVCGHNIPWDIRFVAQRCAVNGIGCPDFLSARAKPWDNRIIDTMTLWAGHGGRISLDRLAKALGMQGKRGVTGADVWPMYQRGELDRIAEYCRADVNMTREVYRRLVPAFR